MIPAALASQLEQGIADFLRMSFWSSTPGMEGVIDRLIGTPGVILKGPYVSASLPFRQGSAAELFPEIPLRLPRAHAPGADVRAPERLQTEEDADAGMTEDEADLRVPPLSALFDWVKAVGSAVPVTCSR
jgi:hypothetical protein